METCCLSSDLNNNPITRIKVGVTYFCQTLRFTFQQHCAKGLLRLGLGLGLGFRLGLG